MISYHTFPLVKLCILLDDESKIEEMEVSKEDWEKVKQTYQNENTSPEQRAILEAYRKVILASIELNRNILLMKFLLISGEDWKEYFESANLKYTGNPEKDSKYLKTQLDKSSTKEKIYTAQLEKLEKQIDEAKENEPKEDLNISKIYQLMAGMEANGANIPDYEKFTIGQYNAWTEIIKQKNRK